MRVGVLGPQYPDSFADNVAHCLPDLGVDVVRLGAARYSTRSLRVNHLNDLVSNSVTSYDARQQARAVDAAVDSGCDVVISVASGLLPTSVAKFRNAGIPIALWFPDAVANLGRQLMIAGDYSRVYFKDASLVERLVRQTGLPVAYLPEACNPTWHKPQADAPAIESLVLVGNMYPSRVRVLEHLVADDVPLELYGGGFPRWLRAPELRARHTGRHVTRLDKSRIFRGARAVLNNLHPAESGVNCRLFEAAGSGAAVLCESRDALADLFTPDEVIAYESYDELVVKARQLLEDPDLGRRFGDAATVRAHAEHTYQHRLARILEDLS